MDVDKHPAGDVRAGVLAASVAPGAAAGCRPEAISWLTMCLRAHRQRSHEHELGNSGSQPLHHYHTLHLHPLGIHLAHHNDTKAATCTLFLPWQHVIEQLQAGVHAQLELVQGCHQVSAAKTPAHAEARNH